MPLLLNPQPLPWWNWRRVRTSRRELRMSPLNWWGSAFRRAVKLRLRIQYVYVTENMQTTSVKITNLKAVKDLQLEDAKLCRAVQALAAHCQSVTSFVDYTPPSEIVGSGGVLWESPRVQEALEKSHDFCSLVYAKDYLESIHRLALPEYLPTDMDILSSRHWTVERYKAIFNISQYLVILMWGMLRLSEWYEPIITTG